MVDTLVLGTSARKGVEVQVLSSAPNSSKHLKMTQKHYIIYIPGIQDDVYFLQSTLIKIWRLYGVHGHCHSMPWAGSETYDIKFKRLLDEIDAYIAQGHRISLFGASAGASAVLNAYVERPDHVSGLIYVCAKINAPETVSQKTYATNPAFQTSMERLQTSLTRLTAADKAKMRSYYSPGDQIVPYPATIISAVPEKRLPRMRHGQAIIYSLTFGALGILRFLKQQSVTYNDK